MMTDCNRQYILQLVWTFDAPSGMGAALVCIHVFYRRRSYVMISCQAERWEDCVYPFSTLGRGMQFLRSNILFCSQFVALMCACSSCTFSSSLHIHVSAHSSAFHIHNCVLIRVSDCVANQELAHVLWK